MVFPNHDENNLHYDIFEIFSYLIYLSISYFEKSNRTRGNKIKTEREINPCDFSIHVSRVSRAKLRDKSREICMYTSVRGKKCNRLHRFGPFPRMGKDSRGIKRTRVERVQ